MGTEVAHLTEILPRMTWDLTYVGKMEVSHMNVTTRASLPWQAEFYCSIHTNASLEIQIFEGVWEWFCGL
jgi:hypothetical protein